MTTANTANRTTWSKLTFLSSDSEVTQADIILRQETPLVGDAAYRAADMETISVGAIRGGQAGAQGETGCLRQLGLPSE